MSNINLSGINSLANPQTQAAGTRALIKLLQNLNEKIDKINSYIYGNATEITSHTKLTDMPSKTNADHDDRYSIYVGATEPSSPVDGKLWLDTSEDGIVPSGIGVPSGGDEGQVLAKASDDDHDLEWVDVLSASVSGIPSGGTAGQILAKASGDDYDVEWVDASGTETFVVTTVDTANSTTSLADITGLSFPVVSGNTYYWECNIFMTVTNVGHGAGIAPNGPSFTLLSWEVRVPSLVTGASYRRDNGWATNYTSTTSATTETVWPLRGFVTPSANGSVAMQVRAESDGNTVTVKAGSWLKWMQVK